MNQDWLNWTRLNLGRGCDPKEIFSILRSNGFSEQEIRAAMSPDKGQKPKYIEFVNSKGEPIPFDGIQPGLDYTSMARPCILTHPKLEKIDVKGVQLYILENFMSAEECSMVIDVMANNLRPSTITSTDKDSYRTSTTCDLGYIDADIVKKIDKKISQTLGIHLPWSDSIEGQKYEVGQEFKAHTDYYEPCSMEFKNFAGDLGQRTWTFMVNLNKVERGGATYFTKINKTFYPKLGRALVWNNLNQDGSPNPMTEHQGMPVEAGHKFIITKWFRDKGTGEPLYPSD